MRAARGTVINAAFNVSLQVLGFFKGFIVAAFLTRTDYGIWGLLTISLGTLLWIAQLGFDDKYVQQEAEDQEAAFHLAFTLQSMLAGAFMVLMAAALPLFALVYHEPRIIVPGLVLTLGMPAAALQTPLWVFYRRLDFMKQRRLNMVDPLTSLLLTAGLAAAGFGYWSLVFGTLSGSWAAAAMAVRHSPYSLRFRFDRAIVREYVSFSWPLLLSSGSSIVIAQVPILIAQRHLGTAAIGAITLAGTISLYTTRVDDIVTTTLYPAICRVRDRAELLLESFVKSNRLAMLWGVPCGVAIALFAHDVAFFVIGKRWEPAVPVMQIIALAAGINQLGFNWSAYYRASNNTRPIAVAAAAMMVAVIGFTTPLILTDGVRGYAIGMAAATTVVIGMRCYYLKRLFPNLQLARHTFAAMAPTVPAVACVLLIRLLSSGPRTAGQAVVEAVLFGVLVIGTTVLSQRTLLREIFGYLRGTVPGPVA